MVVVPPVLLALPEQNLTFCGSPGEDAQNLCTLFFFALATASSFLSCFSATGTVAYPRAAATSCCDLLSPFPVKQNRSRVGITLLVKRSVSSCTYSLPTDFGEKARPEKNCHYLRVGFDDLRGCF